MRQRDSCLRVDLQAVWRCRECYCYHPPDCINPVSITQHGTPHIIFFIHRSQHSISNSAYIKPLLLLSNIWHWYRLYMDFRTALILGQYSIQAKSSVHCYWITLSKHYFTTSTLIGWWPIVLMISGSSYSLQLLLGQHGGGYRLLFIIDYCIIFDKLSCFISTTK